MDDGTEDILLLKRLGLTEYESRVLLSLIALGPSTVRELVAYSRLPKNKAYETLSGLERKRIIATLPVTPRKYKVENLEVLNATLQQKKAELAQLEKSIGSFQERLSQDAREYKEFFWVIKGQRAIQEKLKSHDDFVHREILSMNRLSVYLPANMRTIKAAVRRGVKVRFICLLERDNLENVLRWQETGAEIRVYNKELFGEVMPRFSVFDKTTVRITIGKPEIPKEEEYLSLWTESPALASIFRNYFLTIWARSEPLEKALRRTHATDRARSRP